MGEVITSEIEQILARLEEIEEERSRSSFPDKAEQDQLINEEHRLNARLTKLQDRVSTAETGTAEERAGAQTDITRTPRLPETPEP